MNSLREANVNTQGKPYYCLDMATRVFGVPNRYNFAWEAWSNAQFRHGTSEPFPSVPVPVWFEWTGTVDGVKQNWGHVAVWFPGKGLLSSPFSTNYKQQWFETPAKLIAYLGGGSYVGWSEDINGVRVADTQEDDMYQGKTAQQWAKERDIVYKIAEDRRALLSRLEQAAGVDTGKVEPDSAVDIAINNIDAKNKMIEQLKETPEQAVKLLQALKEALK